MGLDIKQSAQHDLWGSPERIKAALRQRTHEESLFVLLITAIKRFLARICRFFSLGYADKPTFSSEPGQPMAGGASVASTSSEIPDYPSAKERPTSTVNRVHQKTGIPLDAVAENRWVDSLKAILTLPTLERRHALRVLLQQNFTDAYRVRESCMTLHRVLEARIAAFAVEHQLTAASAVTIFRADVDSGGAIADRVDPNGELRSLTTELKRLECALDDYAHARSRISARAIACGAYTRAELAAVIAQHGFDTTFLFQAERASSAYPMPVLGIAHVSNEAPIEAVSSQEMLGGQDSAQPQRDSEIDCETTVVDVDIDTEPSDTHGLDANIQADSLDVFFKKHSAIHAGKKESRPVMRA